MLALRAKLPAFAGAGADTRVDVDDIAETRVDVDDIDETSVDVDAVANILLRGYGDDAGAERNVDGDADAERRGFRVSE